MKATPVAAPAKEATLQDVFSRLPRAELPASRLRDLQSAVRCFASLVQQEAASIPLDLREIRAALDSIAPAQANISAKRWANLRSDLAAAIHASGLRPMLTTAKLRLWPIWAALLRNVPDQGIRNGLSRFGRWASLRQISPNDVKDEVLERFVRELDDATLVRNVEGQRRTIATCWNRLAGDDNHKQLAKLTIHSGRQSQQRIEWAALSASFKRDVEQFLSWCAQPDPLADEARSRRLAPTTIRLRRDQIHSAVHAAQKAGMDLRKFTSLAKLVEQETFRSLFRQLYNDAGQKLSAYAHGVAGTLIAIACEWVKSNPEIIAKLKEIRGRGGSLPTGLTEKNKSFLRRAGSPEVLKQLVCLPNRLWAEAKRELSDSQRAFIHLQSAVAIDLLLHVPLRMENLASIAFGKHLHWPQGPGRPALIVFSEGETKNGTLLEFEIPTLLADRLLAFRDQIAPKIIGARPEFLFVKSDGSRRLQDAITVAIERTVKRRIGLTLTPHQFRHLAAKIILDRNPGAYELVRQLLGHKNAKTTTNFYAGVDTQRAGRAHAELVSSLRESTRTIARLR